MSITFQGNPMTLRGKAIAKGDHLPPIRVIKNNLDELKLNELIGKRVYLSVPSIDTGVCDMEVAKFMNYMKDHLDVTCVSISMDLPFALDRWCQAKGNHQVITASDYHFHDFAKATGTYIEELGLLTRAVFVVDSKNTVQYVEYVKEITNEPDYNKVLEVIRQI